MKLALLTGFTAAVSLAGLAAARAETVYIPDAYPAPAATYVVPAPIVEPGYVVTDPGYTVVAPPAIVATPRAVIAAPPMVVEAPAAVVAPPVVVAPAPSSGIVTTGFATTPSCFVDWRGIERCY
jgi:hypothetical protein